MDNTLVSGARNVGSTPAGCIFTASLHPLIMKQRIAIILLASLSLPLLTSAEESKSSKTFKAGEFVFVVAKNWTKKVQARAMSAGGLTYNLETTEAKLDADFYHFGEGQGGGVEANIARWRSQFEGTPAEKTRTKLADGKVEFLHLEGTFLSGPPFGKKTPNKDYAMLGAILTSAQGDVFIKLTGPKSDVAKALESFKTLITSPYTSKQASIEKK